MFIQFEPIYKQVVWGGSRIAPFKGVNLELSHVGESWEVSAVPGNESVVRGGAYDGLTLPQLMQRMGRELMGSRFDESRGSLFPLLVKFIDAENDLSLQVHPDDALAMRRHGTPGKSEMWYVIETRPGASLSCGMSRPVAPHEYDSWISSPRMMEAVAQHPLAAGDVFYLPAGRVHAIGAGTFLAEIQQTSDITYRLYDYGRVGLDGKPRPLHRDEARDAIDFTVQDDYRTHYTPAANTPVTLVECDKFTTRLVDLDAPIERSYAALDSFVILVCIEGSLRLADNEGDTATLSRGHTLLLPARTQWVKIEPQGSAKLLEVNY